MQKKQRKQNKAEVFQDFMNLCATIIQSNFKGYRQRKYYRKFLPLYRRLKQLLYAGFVGWKTRKILKLGIVKNKINEIQSMKIQGKNLQMRITKRDFTDEISRLLKNGLWLYYFSKQNKLPLAQKTIGFGNQKENVVMKKIDLKQAFTIIPKTNVTKITFNEEKRALQKRKFNNKAEIDKNQQTIEIESQKSKEKEIKSKNKKFENPPKPTNRETLKQNPKKLKVDAGIEPEQNKSHSISCETPNYSSSNQLKQFAFHTRPRDYLPFNNEYNEPNKDDVEFSFKQIHMQTHFHRKGLNMTLSKKSAQQQKVDSTPINLEVLQDFTKKKNLLNDEVKESVLENKGVSDFSTNENLKNTVKPSTQKCEPLQSGRSIELQLKKKDFQKRKMQFQKRSKQFKTVALK